ncbi:O-antigen ligase [Ramlibacter tataouinensis]|uniref:O-antigen polymerase n=1 Tax=Ramlibacter tataouinensis TaxID=94132 RepID=UPI0022F3B903|nr:O-antigen polymerase [Ramlibacter tataouinensis]WBY00793.1 O-antigen ligase [Ramlibacter tataouinensis]
MRKPEFPSASPAGPRALPWWTRPSTLSLLFVLPMLLVVYWAGSSELGGLAVRTRNYLSTQHLVLCLGLVVFSAMGAALGEGLQQRTVLQSCDEHLVRAAVCLGVVVLAAYVFWYRSLILDPSVMLRILTGALKPERDEIGRVVGITSLVNCAAPFFSLAGYLVFVRKVRGGVLKALVVLLLLFTFFRAYIWSERLATAEALIPLVLALLLAMPRPTAEQPVRRLLYGLGPYAALPVVFLFFAVAEYFRSWTFYQDRMAFWEFALGRFVSYYYTALNNGAGMLATTEWPSWKFENVLNWLHAFPLGIGAWFAEAVGATTETGDLFLQRYGDPEFNSGSSFLGVTLDLGVGGAILYFALSAFCGGILYSRYRRGDTLALMLYPSVLVAIFESFRYCYWGTSRAFVWLLGAVVVLAALWAWGALGATRSSHDAARRFAS